jgi:hypothetical protein
MTNRSVIASCIALTLALYAQSVSAQTAQVDDDTKQEHMFQVQTSVEIGFLGVMSHKIQFDRGGTYFDYKEDGGQDNLFAFVRPSVELGSGRHRIIFLYQPLEINTAVTLRQDLIVDGETFAAGTPLDLQYGFPFYRISYMYDVVEDPKWEVGLGASMQVRNATITFSSADGTQRRSNRDVGLVPILKARVRYNGEGGWFLGTEIDGFYAPIKYINGGRSDVVGAIVDWSVRYGFRANEEIDAFINLRWIGGGAEGTSNNNSGFGDGYNRNWLNFLTISLGFNYDLWLD